MYFIDPSADLSLNIGLYLILVDELSLNKNLDSILTIERAAIYAFMLKNPHALARTLLSLKKKVSINIKDYELGNVSTFYPNKARYYRLKETKDLIQLLYAYSFVKIEINHASGEAFIRISDLGSEVSVSLKSEYFARIREIAMAVELLHSTSISSIRNCLNLVLNEK